MRLQVAALPLALMLLLGTAMAARAHAVLLRSDPPDGAVLKTAPEQVRLWFSEPPEPGFVTVRVLSESGAPVGASGPQVDPDDPTSVAVMLDPVDPGRYSVSWRVLSRADGHVSAGTFTIAIGVQQAGLPPLPEQATSQTPLEAATRALGYLGLAALMGSLLFVPLVLVPAARNVTLQRAILLRNAFEPHRFGAAWVLLLVGTIGLGMTQLASLGAGAGFTAEPGAGL